MNSLVSYSISKRPLCYVKPRVGITPSLYCLKVISLRNFAQPTPRRSSRQKDDYGRLLCFLRALVFLLWLLNR